MDPEILRNFTLEQKQFHESWKDWESWEANPLVREAFPYFRSGYDQEGRVGTQFYVKLTFELHLIPCKWLALVYIVPFGKWNYRTLMEFPKNLEEEFWKYYEQHARRLERDAAVNNDDGVVAIVDWDCFTLAHFATPEGKF